MRRVAIALALASLPSLPWGTARGEPQVATGGPRLAPVVPTLKLAASTDDAARIQASLSVLVALDDRWNLDVAPQLAVASSAGIANLFSVDSSGLVPGKQWSGGLTLTLWGYGASRPADAERAILDEAYAACRRLCPPAATAKDDVRAFCAATATSATPSEHFSPEQLCDEGKRRFSDPERPIPLPQGAVPRWFLSVGGAVSGQGFDWYANDTATLLVPHAETRVGGAVGVSAAFVAQRARRGAWSLELGSQLEESWAGSTTPVHWCTPAGTVGAAMAETCSDAILGAPSATWRLTVAVAGGYLDVRVSPADHNRARTAWRAAIGPWLDWRSGTGPDDVRIGARAPLTVDLASVIGLNTDGYKGLLRLVPVVAAEHGVHGWGPLVLLTVEVLGDRYILDRALDTR